MATNRKHGFALSTLVLLLSSYGMAHADTVTMGNNGADQPAGGLTPATTVYNPAGMVLFDHPEVTGSLIYGADHAKFNGTATNNDPILAEYGVPPYTQNGYTHTTAKGSYPGIFGVYPFGNKVVAGLGIYSPYAGSVDFDNDTLVRYQTTGTTFEVIDITPAIALKITPKFSAGFGLDLDRMIYDDNSSSINPEAPGIPASDYRSTNAARSWGYGWHTGVMYQFTNQTRVGLTYTSKITEHLSGNSKLYDPNQNEIGYSNNFKVTVPFPYQYSLGAYHDFNNRWSAMADVHYTGLGVSQTITATGIANGGTTTTTRTEYPLFRNTWGGDAAVNYKINQDWLVRGGFGLEQSAVRNSNNQQLTANGNTSKQISIGAHYQITKMVGLDAGFTRIYVPSVYMNNYNPSSGVGLTGDLHNTVNAGGLQLTWKFA